MSGLNDGFALDDEEPVGTHPEPVEPPPQPLEDIVKSDDMMAAIENSIIDLEDLAVDISTAEGMTQDFALEAMRIVPGILSAPKEHFTLSPSATRYKVSLEEIDKGIWGLIAAAVVAVLALIYKIYKWLAGDKSESGKGSPEAAVASLGNQIDANKRIGQIAEDVSDDIKKAEDVLRDGINVSDASLSGLEKAKATAAQNKLNRYSSFDQLIGKLLTDDGRYEHAKKFLEANDPFFHDVINRGDYTKICEDAADAMLQLKDAVKQKVALLKEIVVDDVYSMQATTSWKNHKQLDSGRFTDPILIKFRGEEMTMEMVAKAVRNQKEKTEGSKVSGRINFDQLFNRCASIYKKPTNQHILEVLQTSVAEAVEIQKEIDYLQVRSSNLAHDGRPGHTSEGVAVRVRQAVLGLGKDLYGYGHLMHELRFYVMNVNYLATEAVGFGLEIVRKISHAMRLDGEEVPQEWQSAQASLRANLEAMRTLHRQKVHDIVTDQS